MGILPSQGRRCLLKKCSFCVAKCRFSKATPLVINEILAIRRKLRDFANKHTDRDVLYYCSVVDSDLTKAVGGHDDSDFRRGLMRKVFSLAVAIRRAQLNLAAA